MTRREFADLKGWLHRRLEEADAEFARKLAQTQVTKRSSELAELKKTLEARLDTLESKFAEQSLPVMPTRRTPDRERPARPLPD